MSTFKTIAKLSAGLLVASLALAGCSNDPEPTEPTETTSAPTTQESTPATEPSTETSTPATEPSTETSTPATEPSTGTVDGTFTGTGYQLVIPDGWKEDTSQQGQWELMLLTDPPTDSSLNVIVAPASGLDLDTFLDQAKTALANQAKEVNDAPEKSVDGQPAKGFEGTLNMGDLPYAQYYMIKDGNAYVLTFGGSAGTDAVDTILGAWTWSS